MQLLKNHVQLIGHAGKEVEIFSFDSGKKKASISLATSQSYKNASGEYVTNTQWHNIVAWGNTAEAMEKTIKKGDQVVITGSLNYRSYEDKTGATRTTTEILVTEFYRVNKSKSEAPDPILN